MAFSWHGTLIHQKALLHVDGLMFCASKGVLEDLALFSNSKMLITTSIKEELALSNNHLKSHVWQSILPKCVSILALKLSWRRFVWESRSWNFHIDFFFFSFCWIYIQQNEKKIVVLKLSNGSLWLWDMPGPIYSKLSMYTLSYAF